MKIALFNHPFTDFYTSPRRLNPLILDYLEELLNPIKCIKFDVIKNIKKPIELPTELYYLKEWLFDDLTQYSFFKRYYKFGDEKNFDHSLFLSFKPHAIFVTSFAFCYFEDFKNFILYLKSITPDIPIFCGGAGPSSFPEYYINNSLVDFVVVGPLELNKLNLFKIIKELKKNKIISKRIIKPDLSKKYYFKPMIEKKENIVYVQLTRGCPKKCIYCSIHLTTGDKYRYSRLKDIKKKIKKLKKDSHLHIDFEDDNISYNKKYLVKVLKIFKKYLKSYSISFENGIDFTTLDEEIVNILKNNNLRQWNVSLASINKEMLRKTERNYTIDKFENILSKLKKACNFVIAYFICGLPGDSKENILSTLKFLVKSDVLIGISMFYPVPNTPIAKNFALDKTSAIFTKASSFYPWAGISTESLVTFFILSRFANIFKKDLIMKIKLIKKMVEENEIKIDGDKVYYKKADREILTFIGVYFSLKSKEIYGIKKVAEDEYLLKKYNLEEELVKEFFNFLFDNFVEIREIL